MQLTALSLDLACATVEEESVMPSGDAQASGPPASPPPPPSPPAVSTDGEASPPRAEHPASAPPSTPPTDADESQGGSGDDEAEPAQTLALLGNAQPGAVSPPAQAPPSAAGDQLGVQASMASMLESERAVVSSQPDMPTAGSVPGTKQAPLTAKPVASSAATAPLPQTSRKRKGLFASKPSAVVAPTPSASAKTEEDKAPKAKSVTSVKSLKPLVSKKLQAGAKAAAKTSAPKDDVAAGAVAAPVVKARSSYILFQIDRRPSIKEANPGMSSKELVAEIAKIWNGLTPEEKKPYVDKAAAEKAEKAKSQPAGEKPPAKKKSKKSEGGGAGGGAAKSGWTAFRKAHKARVQDDHPGATADVVDKVLRAEWQELDADDKADYAKIDSAPKEPPAKKPKPPPKAKALPKPADEAEVGDEPMEEADDEEEIDWVATPAEAIMSQSLDGKFQVKRLGMDLAALGEVDARAARGHNLTGAAGPSSGAHGAVSPSMIADFDLFNKRFDAELAKRVRGREIELDDLPPGSPLEAMRFLGDLRDDAGVLSGLPKGGKGDILVKIPMVGLSRVVQRMLEVERRGLEQKYRGKCAELDAALAKAKGAQSLAPGAALAPEP